MRHRFAPKSSKVIHRPVGTIKLTNVSVNLANNAASEWWPSATPPAPPSLSAALFEECSHYDPDERL